MFLLFYAPVAIVLAYKDINSELNSRLDIFSFKNIKKYFYRQRPINEFQAKTVRKNNKKKATQAMGRTDIKLLVIHI